MVDCLKQNFKLSYENSNIVVYDKENNIIDKDKILKFLTDDFELELNYAFKVITTWYMGDLYSDYIEEIYEDL